jgi:hypothetical protein
MRDRPRATARVGGAQGGGFNCGGGSERTGSPACARSSIAVLRTGCNRVMAHAQGQGKPVQGVRRAGLCCRGSATAEQGCARWRSAGARCPGHWSGLRAKKASLKGRRCLGGAHCALDRMEVWRRVDSVVEQRVWRDARGGGCCRGRGRGRRGRWHPRLQGEAAASTCGGGVAAEECVHGGAGARRGGVRRSAAVLGSGLRWRAWCGRRGLGTEFKGRAEDHGVWDREEGCGYRGRRSRGGAAVARSRGHGGEGDAGGWVRTVSGRWQRCAASAGLSESR